MPKFHTARGEPIRILMRGVLDGHGYTSELVDRAVERTWSEFIGVPINDDTAKLMVMRLHFHAEELQDG